MKYKTTAKAIREESKWRKTVSAGYCDLQALLSGRQANAYTCGVYGWNFDVYDVNGITITTGYRGMVGRRANNIREYEKRAEEIQNRRKDADQTWEEFFTANKNDLEALLAEFCEQA